MQRFNLFLIISLSLTAFWAGYLIMKRDIGLDDSKSKTGTILDKFESNKQQVTDDQRSEEQDAPFLIANRKVVSTINSPNKKSVLYFEKNTGKLFEHNLETDQEAIISEAMLPNFISAIWSPAEKETVSSFYSPDGVNFKYHSYKTSKTTSLDPNIRSVSFSPDGNLLAYFYTSPNRLPDPEQSVEDSLGQTTITEPNKVFIAQPDGSYSKKILDTRLDNIALSWPTREWIAFKTPASEVFLLNPEGKLNKFLESKPALEEKWSRTGKKMLYSAISEYAQTTKPVLSVKELDSRAEKYLDIEGMASKCVWSIDDVNIYCAFAKSPSADEIYLINISDDSRKFITDLEVQAKELLLSPTEDYLMFVSASDEKLYGIKISN